MKPIVIGIIIFILYAIEHEMTYQEIHQIKEMLP